MRDGPSSSRSWPEALASLTVEKARGLVVEDFAGGVVGFRLPEEGGGGDAAEAESPPKTARARRKAAAG